MKKRYIIFPEHLCFLDNNGSQLESIVPISVMESSKTLGKTLKIPILGNSGAPEEMWEPEM